MTEGNSYRQILRSSSIIGGASVVNILVGLLRMKVVAVLLGPSGLGLIGLLQNLMTTVSKTASLGFGTVGTRQVAKAVGRGDPVAVAAARRALFWGSLGLAALGALATWLLREVLARVVLGDAGMAGEVGWLSLGVALAVGSGSQRALLNGMRRMGDLARISVGSALLATIGGVGAIAWLGEDGVLAFVLVSPLAGFLLGHLYVARIPRNRGPRTPFRALLSQWAVLARLGVAFMLAGLTPTLGQLAVRTLIQRELGPEALGHFEAAWMISMTYIGFVLGAMGTDYYPRLSAVIQDSATANRLVNEQTEVALLLAGPVLVVMLGFAPVVIQLLFSSQFGDSVAVLRWQVFGDVLKVVSWPLGFIMLATGDGRHFVFAEATAMAVFVGATWVGLPLIGIQATGVAFVSLYVVYLPIVYWFAARRTGLVWRKGLLKQLFLLMAGCTAICAAALWSEWAARGLSLALATVLGLHGVSRLGTKAELGGRLGRVSLKLREAMRKFGMKDP